MERGYEVHSFFFSFSFSMTLILAFDKEGKIKSKIKRFSFKVENYYNSRKSHCNLLKLPDF
jgi:hypothetical protein